METVKMEKLTFEDYMRQHSKKKLIEVIIERYKAVNNEAFILNCYYEARADYVEGYKNLRDEREERFTTILKVLLEKA